jgi:hypothetical protein
VTNRDETLTEHADDDGNANLSIGTLYEGYITARVSSSDLSFNADPVCTETSKGELFPQIGGWCSGARGYKIIGGDGTYRIFAFVMGMNHDGSKYIEIWYAPWGSDIGISAGTDNWAHITSDTPFTSTIIPKEVKDQMHNKIIPGLYDTPI